MIASDLSSSFNAAIDTADFGAKLVIFGIFVEVIDLIVKCGDNDGFCKWFGHPGRGEEMNLNRLKRFSKFFHPGTLAIEMVSFMLVVFGLCIEVSGSNEAYRISALQNSIFNREAGEARRIAGQANERAANIGTTNAQLVASNLATDLRVEELRKANAILKEQSLPMQIGEQNSFALDIGPPQNISIIITNNLQDEKARRTAWEINWVMEHAGWNVSSSIRDAPTGIKIEFAGKPEDDNPLVNSARSLQKALLDRNLPAMLYPSISSLPPNTLVIDVQGWPDPQESENIIEMERVYEFGTDFMRYKFKYGTPKSLSFMNKLEEFRLKGLWFEAVRKAAQYSVDEHSRNNPNQIVIFRSNFSVLASNSIPQEVFFANKILLFFTNGVPCSFLEDTNLPDWLLPLYRSN